MTKKDFIRILLKLAGIYMLFSSLVPLIGSMTIYSQADWDMLLGLAAVIIVAIAFCSWFIFFPDSIINLFRLNKGFDDDQIKTEQLKGENLISFAVIIIGGLFLVYGFVPFLVDICQRFYLSVADKSSFFLTFETLDNSRLYTYIVELFIGFFLVFNYPKISRFLAKKNLANDAE